MAQSTEPNLFSVFPLGAAAGSKVELIVRGENLEGAYGAWFDCSLLQGEVKSVQEIEIEAKEPKDGEKPKKAQQASVRTGIAAAAAPGAHALRIITPHGVSGPLWFIVNAEPTLAETGAKHDTPADAQPLQVPSTVSGKLSKPGELDYYAFEVRAGQRLRFELVSFALDRGGVSADPQLILYEPSKSWFNPQKGRRLEVDDESRPSLGDFSDITAHRLPRLIHRFEKAGRYIAEVGTLEGDAGPDYSYQLRIVPLEDSGQRQERWGPIVQAHNGEALAWQKRGFPGALEPNRIEQLSLRGLAAPSPSAIAVLHADRGIAIPIPAIVEGAVHRPGDVDVFKFHAEPGQQLALEIETPYLPPPYFNPRVAVFDSQGRELFTNIYASLGGDGDDWIKTVEPKVLYRFESGGEYRLEARDLTSRLGGADFAYRILIRPQVPHLGEVQARIGSPARKVDHLNLAAGASQAVSVVSDLEEGFEGEVALSVENLPSGVKIFPAMTSAVEKSTAPASKPGGEIHKERFRAPKQTATLLFVADPDAPPTNIPQLVELKARPIVKGKLGRQLSAQHILLAVTPPATAPASAQPRPETSPKD